MQLIFIIEIHSVFLGSMLWLLKYYLTERHLVKNGHSYLNCGNISCIRFRHEILLQLICDLP
jgi:hypothetical protein